jgi:hypothetical protein
MARRLALGSPYSKPSTAEDGLRTRQADDALPDLTQPSIAAVHALRNAAIGLRIAGRFALWVFALELIPFKHRNRAGDIAPMVATLTADRLQQQKRKQMFLKETARAGAIGLLSTTFPAVKFLEKPAP